MTTRWMGGEVVTGQMTPALRKTWWLMRAEKLVIQRQIDGLERRRGMWDEEVVDSLIERRERRLDRVTVFMEMLLAGRDEPEEEK